MKVDTRDLVNATDVNKNAARYLREAAHGRDFVVLKNSKPTAGIVSMETLERVERISELEEDIRMLSIALVRTLTDDGRRHTLDDIARDLGIDASELDDADLDDPEI